MDNKDLLFLKQTLILAKKGIGWTNPNPMVGALLVKNNKIIGKGYHKKFGTDHAEIVALKNVTENPNGATLYVNLEPCVHYGKTPPCADAIIQAGIKRVVCATYDPNPIIKQKGIKKLQQAGIKITVGNLEKEARQLNEQFFTFHEKKRPFVAIKFAASLDGKMATHTGDSKWITNEKARLFARKLRGEHQAIIVGIHTILKDNPHLGTRIKNTKDPIRIVLDSSLQIPLTAQVLRDTNIIIFTTTNASQKKIKQLIEKEITVISIDKTITIPAVLEELKKREIISVLVEGGGEVLGSFVDARSIDKVYACHSPIIIGGENAISISGHGVEKVSEALRLENIFYKHFGDNLLTIGSVKQNT